MPASESRLRREEHEGGDAAVTRVDVWQMKGIWRGRERWPGRPTTRDPR